MQGFMKRAHPDFRVRYVGTERSIRVNVCNFIQFGMHTVELLIW
jgi:hypothetical protein